MAKVEDFDRDNDDALRESAKANLDYLVSGTFVCNRYGFTIKEVEQGIEDRTMVGFQLGFLGPWLPEWQFIQAGPAVEVSPIALELREAWGDFNLDSFVKVMATRTLNNVPTIGQSSTYAEMVQLGINPLQDPNSRNLFRQAGVVALG